MYIAREELTVDDFITSKNNLLAKIFVPKILALEKKANKRFIFPKTKRELENVHEQISKLSIKSQERIVFEILQKIEENPKDFREDLFFQLSEQYCDIIEKNKGLY